MTRQFLERAKRIVIKIGTSVVTDHQELDEGIIGRIARDVARIYSEHPGTSLALVTSGAIAAGMRILNLRSRPSSIEKLQAIAAVGQRSLMQIYDSAFSKQGILTSQILLTWDDLGHRKRYQNTQKTLKELLRYKALPIINENDTVATEEIQFGDNDQLSAMVAMLIEADLLIILSDANGLYADYKTGRSSRIPMVDDLDASILQTVWDSKKVFSKGGMTSKLASIKKVMGAGIPCLLADGKEQRVLSRLMEGEDIGTLFMPRIKKVPSRKHWIAYVSKSAGTLVIDEGAEEAILKRGKSLLSKGITKVLGHFKPGDAILVQNKTSKVLGRGIVNFSSGEIEKIRGLNSKEWSESLGHPCMNEVMHRDNFVTVP